MVCGQNQQFSTTVPHSQHPFLTLKKNLFTHWTSCVTPHSQIIPSPSIQDDQRDWNKRNLPRLSRHQSSWSSSWEIDKNELNSQNSMRRNFVSDRPTTGMFHIQEFGLAQLSILDKMFSTTFTVLLIAAVALSLSWGSIWSPLCAKIAHSSSANTRLLSDFINSYRRVHMIKRQVYLEKWTLMCDLQGCMPTCR